MRKKIKPVREVLAPAKHLRFFGVCYTPAHKICEKLREHGILRNSVVLVDSVVRAGIIRLDEEKTYVCLSYRQAKKLHERLPDNCTANVIVCDSTLNVVMITTTFLDANAYCLPDKLAWNFEPADNWSLLDDDAVYEAVPCVYDHTRALVSDCSQGSILKPFFTNIYKLPKEQQPLVKDVVVLTLVEKDAEQAKEILSDFFEKTLSPAHKRTFMSVLFENQKYLAPLVELRPYAMAGVDLRDYPSAEIAAKYEVDSYELNYFFQAYKKARRTATVAMEERFFRRGDSLRAKSANKRRQTVASKQQ